MPLILFVRTITSKINEAFGILWGHKLKSEKNLGKYNLNFTITLIYD